MTVVGLVCSSAFLVQVTERGIDMGVASEAKGKNARASVQNASAEDKKGYKGRRFDRRPRTGTDDKRERGGEMGNFRVSAYVYLLPGRLVAIKKRVNGR